MSVHHITQTVRSTIQGWYYLLIGKSHVHYMRYVQYALAGIGATIILGGAFFTYSWYAAYKDRAAQRVLSHYIDEYRKVYAQSTGWGAIEDLFQLGAEQHSGSSLYPYFLGFQADVLVQQGKKEQALDVLDKMMIALPSNKKLTPLFGMKRALLKLDMVNPALQQEGLQELIALARDEKNLFNDAAQYLLGNYYWNQNNIKEAQEVWQTLVQTQQDEHALITSSPWAQLAQQKLQQLA